MRRLHIDFANPTPRWRGASYLFLAFSLAVTGYVASLYIKRQANLDRLEARYQSLLKAQRDQSQQEMVRGPEWERSQNEIKLANQIVDRLALPWESLFQSLDASINENVTLISVEPDTEKHEIRIVAEARNLEAMLQYVDGLAGMETFKNPYVVNHQVQSQDSQRPVRFVVLTGWKETPLPSSVNPAASVKDPSNSLAH